MGKVLRNFLDVYDTTDGQSVFSQPYFYDYCAPVCIYGSIGKRHEMGK